MVEDDATTILDAVIIGSGLGGICQAIKLKERNIHDFLILEKENDLGGTWRDNTYLGAECDVPIALYSYSFASADRHYETFLGQKAVLDYIREVSDNYRVTEHIRYGANVETLRFDEDSCIWNVRVAGGRKHRARFVISAVGQLHHPKIPDFPGANQFQGEAFHTARFGSRTIDHFVGKRVAVIGNGASGIQIIPPLQKVCKELHVYQRTPSYIFPKVRLSRAEEKIIADLPIVRRAAREFLRMFAERALYAAIKGEAWAQLALKKICDMNRSKVKDPEKRDKLQPQYPVGAKRTLFSDDFYPAVDKSNVFLYIGGIKEIYETGILNSDGSRIEVDTIIYATGFITNPLLHGMTVTGRSDIELWKDEKGMRAYLGVATSGFPNLFFLYGPHTNTGHASVVDFLEPQSDFVTNAMYYVKEHGYKSIEVKESAENEFLNHVEQVSKNLTFSVFANSNYMCNGRLVNNWVDTVGEYVASLYRIDFGDDFTLGGKMTGEEEGILGRVNEVEQSQKNSSLMNILFTSLVRIPVYTAMLASQIIRISYSLLRN